MLTENQVELLKRVETENYKVRKKFYYRIRRKALSAIRDLQLLNEYLPEQQRKQIFNEETVTPLLKTILKPEQFNGKSVYTTLIAHGRRKGMLQLAGPRTDPQEFRKGPHYKAPPGFVRRLGLAQAMLKLAKDSVFEIVDPEGVRRAFGLTEIELGNGEISLVRKK